MRSFWSDPYLWIHLAGLAALPIFLELCLIGFAMGDPVMPVWLELLLVAVIGIVPILWMQWQRPFYIFSVVAVSLKPEQLTEDQRRLLTLFTTQRNRVLAAIAPLLLLVLLYQIYTVAAIASEVVPSSSHWLGLLLAALAFLGSNLFLQVPLSVAGVMLTRDSEFATTDPYPVEQIRQRFSLFGLLLNQILPPLLQESRSKSIASVAPEVQSSLESDRAEAGAQPGVTTEDAPEVETAAAETVEAASLNTLDQPTLPSEAISSEPDATPEGPTAELTGESTEELAEEASVEAPVEEGSTEALTEDSVEAGPTAESTALPQEAPTVKEPTGTETTAEKPQ